MNKSLPGGIRFGRAICAELAQAERREWWLSNGLGAYAGGTVAGSLTRCYHGLLVAPVQPPLGRCLLFAKAEATLVDGDSAWPLACNRWASGVIAPQGHVHIESFYLDGRMPVWRYVIGDLTLEQRIWMEPGAHTTYVALRLLGDPGRMLQLNLKLLVNARDHHVVATPDSFSATVTGDAQHLQVASSAETVLHLRARGGVLAAEHTWYENFDLPAERARGLPDRDAHLCIGELRFVLVPGEWTGVVASLHSDASPFFEAALRRALSHDAALLARTPQPTGGAGLLLPTWIQQLHLAADGFLIARPLPGLPEGESVIAGYPWFGDWGRDTLVALPGLCLATGRFEDARRILNTFAHYIDGGMLPNYFPGAGATPQYNSVDAALWYIEAWRAYVESSGDVVALRAVYATLVTIIDNYIRGTRYGIGVDARDDLLHAGAPGVQLTWMDAKLGDWVVTPRQGKPVEVNALWYNALCCMAGFAAQLGESHQPYRDRAVAVRRSFARFVRADAAGLYDVLDTPQGDDAACRPNQIFAVSLRHSPLDTQAQRDVVAVCARRLLTSYGLRSLAADEPAYRPYYQGGVAERDSAYHQGTVWCWLLG
ncbi:MAG: amylo-alpha-1,6-glucosidase, partial [Gammaproteobacteria bacterium]